MTELSFWLDHYDDLFSDFDSRHYLKRRISEDFIDELKTALKNRQENPETLVLMLPQADRSPDTEGMIQNNLKEQFQRRLEELERKAGNAKKHGVILLLSGIAIMVVDSIISYRSATSYPVHLVRIIMEPAGWFMIWNGLECLSYKYRSIRKELKFYRTVQRLSFRFSDA